MCTCTGTYTGRYCELEDGCKLDYAGKCCAANRLLALDGTCCAVGHQLDAAGNCCARGLDACGVCGGSGVLVDSLGSCCFTSTVDAGGKCCYRAVDECGKGVEMAGRQRLRKEVKGAGLRAGLDCS